MFSAVCHVMMNNRRRVFEYKIDSLFSDILFEFGGGNGFERVYFFIVLSPIKGFIILKSRKFDSAKLGKNYLLAYFDLKWITFYGLFNS